MTAGSFVPGVRPKIKCTAAACCYLCRFENCEVAGDRVCRLVFIKKSLLVIMIRICMCTHWYSIRSQYVVLSQDIRF